MVRDERSIQSHAIGAGQTAPLSRRARGSAYLLVLGASILLVVAGTGAIYAAGIRRASAELNIESWRARLAAEGGIDAALEAIRTDSNWRTTYRNGTAFASLPMTGAAARVTLADPLDGDISNNIADSVQVLSQGTSGRAQSKLQVTLSTRSVAYSSLDVAMCSGGIQTHTGTTIANGQTIGSNLAITATLASISGRVESTVSVLGLIFTGTTASLVPARTLPGADAFTYYTTVGSSAGSTTLPLVGGKRALTRQLVSPGSAPLMMSGSTQGIYVIDCQGNDVTISNSRIVGTIVLLNTGAGSKVTGAINWTPSVANYPCLLVSGPMTIDIDQANGLSEAGTPGVNFNPASTPYLGASDSDTTDSYPTEIKGLIYIAGSLTLGGNPKITGNLIVRDSITSTGSLTLVYDATWRDSPPPGFATTSVMISPGSWKQLVD